jgi:hypothetical protein
VKLTGRNVEVAAVVLGAAGGPDDAGADVSDRPPIEMRVNAGTSGEDASDALGGSIAAGDPAGMRAGAI